MLAFLAMTAGERLPGSDLLLNATARLVLCGAGMLAAAFVFATRFPLRGNTHRLTDIGLWTRYSRFDLALFSGGVLWLFGCYVFGLREAQRLRSPQAFRFVMLFGAAAAIAFAAMYPVTAIDLFVYAVRSRLLTRYGEDPNAVAPAIHTADAWRNLAGEWQHTVSPYGPVWNLIAAPGTILSGDRPGLALAYYKAIAAISAIAGAWLAARCVEPTHRASAALLYLWNPLVLWEGVGNGHNDLVMMVPVFAAVLAWRRERDWAVIPLLLAAALIKFVPFLLMPVAGVAVIRRAIARGQLRPLALRSASLSLVVLAIGFAPFFDPGTVWSSTRAQAGILLTSPAAVANSYLVPRLDTESARAIVRVAAVVWLGANVLVQVVLTWRNPARLPRAMFEVLFAYLLFGALTYRSWYVIWLVGLAAVLKVGWPALRALTWSATALFIYAFYIWVWHWWQPGFPTIQTVAVAVMFAPPLLISLAELGIWVVATGHGRSPLSGVTSRVSPAEIKTARD